MGVAASRLAGAADGPLDRRDGQRALSIKQLRAVVNHCRQARSEPAGRERRDGARAALMLLTTIMLYDFVAGPELMRLARVNYGRSAMRASSSARNKKILCRPRT